MSENNDGGIEQIQLLDGIPDSHGGVTVVMKEPMDAHLFAPLLRASLSSWKQQEGFRYHHSEPKYLILVRWLPYTIPVNASHMVGVGAFVLNDKREVLVVQQYNSGRFKGTRKLPTGVVNEGEDICHAIVRVVKEETGVDTEFIEVLCIRQDHKSFFSKSDLFFLCELQPQSSSIERQNAEVEVAQWMPIEEYAAQPFVVGNEQFNSVVKICLARANDGCPGFAPFVTMTRSGKRSYIYCNNNLGVRENFASSM